MLVRVKDKAFSPTTTDIVDSTYDPNVENIEIIMPGVLVTVNSTRNNYKWFLPWSQINFIMGGPEELSTEHFLNLQDAGVAHATRD